MAVLSKQTPALAGVAITFGAAAGGGDSFENTGREILLIKNGGAGAITVTADAPGTCDFGLAGNAAHDAAVSVANDSVPVAIGPFVPIRKFNDANNRVQITYSGVGTVTVAVVAV